MNESATTISNYDIFMVCGVFVSFCIIIMACTFMICKIVEFIKRSIGKRKPAIYGKPPPVERPFPVKSICLEGGDAERFVKNAEIAEKNRGTIDFTEEMAAMRKIIEKMEKYNKNNDRQTINQKMDQRRVVYGQSSILDVGCKVSCENGWHITSRQTHPV